MWLTWFLHDDHSCAREVAKWSPWGFCRKQVAAFSTCTIWWGPIHILCFPRLIPWYWNIQCLTVTRVQKKALTGKPAIVCSRPFPSHGRVGVGVWLLSPLRSYMEGWGWACDYCYHSGATWEGWGGRVTIVTTLLILYSINIDLNKLCNHILLSGVNLHNKHSQPGCSETRAHKPKRQTTWVIWIDLNWSQVEELFYSST